jgi:hypothetical protein
MVRFVQRQGRGLLVLPVVVAIALAGCSGGASTASPSASAETAAPTELATIAPAPPTEVATGPTLAGAAGALSQLASYKFTMTLAGGSVVAQIAMLPGTSIMDTDAPVTIKGTVVTQPGSAIEVRIADFHMIAIGGFDYFDTGVGGYTQASDTGIADSFSPASEFSTAIDPSTVADYNDLGAESKDGVQAEHYQASSAALAYLASIAGVQGTWTSDVWVAVDGGYPVSVAVVATAADKSIPYEILFDITDVNAAGNSVAAPTNVTGA